MKDPFSYIILPGIVIAMVLALFYADFRLSFSKKDWKQLSWKRRIGEYVVIVFCSTLIMAVLSFLFHR